MPELVEVTLRRHEHENCSRPRTKKSLGQNFLVSRSVAVKIVEAVSPKPGELIFEIGPGRGALTVPLGKTGSTIVAYEIDRSLVTVLQEKCRIFENVEVVCADIRGVNLDDEASSRNIKDYKIVGNIPYHLTSTILLDLPGWKGCVAAVLMVQKEVGERIMASPGERSCGVPTVYLQSYLDVSKIARVRPGSFRPRPSVEGVVLKFVPKDARTGPGDGESFLHFLKLCFSHRRKKLKSVFRDSLGIRDASRLENIGNQAGVDLEKRPEELELDDWFRFFRSYRKIKRQE